MKLKPIITSLLETDAYKFNMMNVIFHTFNKDVTKWAFKCRNKNVRFTPEMVQEIREQIDFFCSLRFSKEELEWLAANFPWLKKDFINQLKRWYPDRNDIRINEGDVEYLDECGLAIEANGTWLDTTLYEIAILAIVNEVYFAFSENPMTLDEFKRRTVERLDNLITGVKPIGTFSEFVRRHNRQLHKTTILKGGYRKANQAPKYVFGFRLFEQVSYNGKTCFVFGRRSSGSFDIRTLGGEKISAGVSYKRLKPLTKSTTLLTERSMCDSSQG